jgi:2-oxoisovalerate dehydrogenase E1 component beta subunit
MTSTGLRMEKKASPPPAEGFMEGVAQSKFIKRSSEEVLAGPEFQGLSG